jgi:hypothetical protein
MRCNVMIHHPLLEIPFSLLETPQFLSSTLLLHSDTSNVPSTSVIRRETKEGSFLLTEQFLWEHYVSLVEF